MKKKKKKKTVRTSSTGLGVASLHLLLMVASLHLNPRTYATGDSQISARLFGSKPHGMRLQWRTGSTDSTHLFRLLFIMPGPKLKEVLLKCQWTLVWVEQYQIAPGLHANQCRSACHGLRLNQRAFCKTTKSFDHVQCRPVLYSGRTTRSAATIFFFF
jgi:hypothetical protein